MTFRVFQLVISKTLSVSPARKLRSDPGFPHISRWEMYHARPALLTVFSTTQLEHSITQCDSFLSGGGGRCQSRGAFSSFHWGKGIAIFSRGGGASLRLTQVRFNITMSRDENKKSALCTQPNRVSPRGKCQDGSIQLALCPPAGWYVHHQGRRHGCGEVNGRIRPEIDGGFALAGTGLG